MPPEILELAYVYLKGEIDISQMHKLETWINTDPVNARTFAEHCLVVQELQILLSSPCATYQTEISQKK